MRFGEKTQALLRRLNKPLIISGVLHALLFPKFNLGFLFPVFLLPALIYTLKEGSPLNKGKIFREFFLGGFISYLIILYWIYSVLYMNGAGLFGGLAGYIGLSAYLGLYWGVFGLLILLMKPAGPLKMLFFIPLLWTSLELLKSYLLTGFPWLLSGYSLWRYTPLIQTASITGVYGLSFFVIFINASIALFITEKRKIYPLVAGVLSLLILLHGIIALRPGDDNSDEKKVSLLQGNISQYIKWDAEHEGEILRIYRDLALRAAADEPDIIILPETALPGPVERDPYLSYYIRRMAENTQSSIIFGSVESRRGEYYNSAYAVTPAGGFSSPYRKIHLTPFGEYIPFRGILSNFISVINEIGDFDPGEEVVLLEVAGISAGISICFESIFGRKARLLFKEGAEVFINITNDGWFLDTAGPYQHFIHSVFRAVENRSYALRAANTGISAVIDPKGRVIQKTELLEETHLTGEFSPSERRSFYALFGDIFALSALLCTIIMLFWRRKYV